MIWINYLKYQHDFKMDPCNQGCPETRVMSRTYGSTNMHRDCTLLWNLNLTRIKKLVITGVNTVMFCSGWDPWWVDSRKCYQGTLSWRCGHWPLGGVISGVDIGSHQYFVDPQYRGCRDPELLSRTSDGLDEGAHIDIKFREDGSDLEIGNPIYGFSDSFIPINHNLPWGNAAAPVWCPLHPIGGIQLLGVLPGQRNISIALVIEQTQTITLGQWHRQWNIIMGHWNKPG